MPAKKHVHMYMDGGVSESSYCFKQSGFFGSPNKRELLLENHVHSKTLCLF